MIYSLEQGIKVSVSEFFKALLDMENNDNKKLEFQDLLYNLVLKQFADFIDSDVDLKGEEKAQMAEEVVQTYSSSLEYSRSLILQFFIKCIQEHSYRFRIFAVNNQLIEKISALTKYRSKLLDMWIVKFFKGILKGKDELLI
jgi:hypothetical protein